MSFTKLGVKNNILHSLSLSPRSCDAFSAGGSPTIKTGKIIARKTGLFARGKRRFEAEVVRGGAPRHGCCLCWALVRRERVVTLAVSSAVTLSKYDNAPSHTLITFTSWSSLPYYCGVGCLLLVASSTRHWTSQHSGILTAASIFYICNNNFVVVISRDHRWKLKRASLWITSSHHAGTKRYFCTTATQRFAL